MKSIFSTVVLLACFALSAWAQGYVAMRSGLNLREYGDLSSASLTIIPYGTFVEPVSKDSYGGATINGSKGDWRKVNFNGKTGYVFDGFLLPFPPPELTQNIENYLEKLFPKQAGPITSSDADGREIQQTIFDKGSSIVKWKNGSYSSVIYSITGIGLQKAFLLCKLFPEFLDIIGENEFFPMSDTDRAGRLVKQLMSPDPSNKNIIGIYISGGGKTFRIRENEGRIEITFATK